MTWLAPRHGRTHFLVINLTIVSPLCFLFRSFHFVSFCLHLRSLSFGCSATVPRSTLSADTYRVPALLSATVPPSSLSLDVHRVPGHCNDTFSSTPHTLSSRSPFGHRTATFSFHSTHTQSSLCSFGGLHRQVLFSLDTHRVPTPPSATAPPSSLFTRHTHTEFPFPVRPLRRQVLFSLDTHTEFPFPVRPLRRQVLFSLDTHTESPLPLGARVSFP